jgi:hypothetical protein
LEQLLRLSQLAHRLHLPRPWLRDEARAGRIPCLRIGRKLLFSLPAVERVLANRAAAVERQGVPRA